VSHVAHVAFGAHVVFSKQSVPRQHLLTYMNKERRMIRTLSILRLRIYCQETRYNHVLGTYYDFARCYFLLFSF